MQTAITAKPERGNMNAHVSSSISSAAIAVAASVAVASTVDIPEPAPALGPSDFVIRRADLAAAVAIVNRVVEKRNTIPILSNLRILASAGIVMIVGTDLDIQITHAVECISSSGVMDVTVEADMVNKMLRKSDAVELRFAHDGGDGPAVVTWGDFRMKLVTLPATDFPMMGDLAFTHSFALPGGDLCETFNGVKAAISKEETRYYLNGVFMHVPEVNETSLLFVTTDGHRLNKAWLDCPAGADCLMGYRDSLSYNPGVIIPRKTVKMFLDIADTKARPDTVQIDVGLSKMRLSFGNTEIVSKLIDGTFPDYSRWGGDGGRRRDLGAARRSRRNRRSQGRETHFHG
jgi:DNA polymerase-3 subunit beta